MDQQTAKHPVPTYRPWLHGLTVLLVGTTFCLIVLGATVTSKGVGLAVPDWPTTFGYNLFLFPPSMWVGGLFWEHTHRLLGSMVGLLAIATVLSLWRFKAERMGVLLLGVGVLVLVVIQGVMGGLRVTQMSVAWAVLHGITGQIVLCAMVVLAAATGRLWIDRSTSRADRSVGTGGTTSTNLFGARMRIASYLVMAALLAQVAVGAATRHTGAGLAIPDFPSSYGRILPPLTQAELTATIDGLPYEEHVGYYTVGQVAVHFAHRVGAVVLLAVMGGWIGYVLQRSPQNPVLVRPATTIVAMLLVQVMLGATVVWSGRHAEIATAHTAVGAALMAATTWLIVRIHLPGGHAAPEPSAAISCKSHNRLIEGAATA